MEFNEKSSKSLAKTGRKLPEPDRKLYEDKNKRRWHRFSSAKKN